jgi:V8-like Glu-specific endopeptidase
MINKIFLLFFILVGSVHSAEPDQELHYKCIYPVIRIQNKSGNSFGSAFVVRSEKVGNCYHNVAVTCQHVTDGKTSIVIRTPEYVNWSTYVKNIESKGVVYFENVKEDLAVVLFKSDKALYCCDFNFDENLYIGNDVEKTGFGEHNIVRHDWGKITSVNISIDSSEGYRFTCPTVPGDSGGPLFYKNQVVGIIKGVATFNSNQLFTNCGVAVKAATIKRLSEENPEISFLTSDSKLPALPYMQLKFIE